MTRQGSGYQVGRPTGACTVTGQPLAPGTPYVATLCERPEDGGLERRDFSMEAWEGGTRPEGLFSFWKTVAVQPDARRKLLVDDEALLSIFERLATDERPQRIAFRFVLALILMRKRILRYVSRSVQPGGEKWLMQLRGAGPDAPPVEVINPQLADEDIRELTDQLSEILQTEF
jgi:hypothetical protein